MSKKSMTIIVVLILAGIAIYATYNLFSPRPTPGGQTERILLKPVSLRIMTDWSQWGQDDFKRYFFAESGMPRAGVILPSAAAQLNITNISFVRVLDPSRWVEAGQRGEVDGFVGQNRYNISYICRKGGLRPIEDPKILELTKYIPEIFKGYTEDGKLCWIAMYWQPYPWLINKEYAEKNGLPIPESWLDLIKPEFLSASLKGVKLLAIYPVTNRPATSNAVNTIIAKYGWEKGWAIIATLFGGASTLYTSSSAARTAITAGRALLTILEFDDAYTAYSMFPDKLDIKFPKNETGFWMTPIAIAAGVSEDGLDGMYRLIRWVLTDMQDKMLLNRSGWLFMPVLGWNNTSPRMMYRTLAIDNLYAPTSDMELALGEAGPVITLYADLITTDTEVRDLLSRYIKKVVEKYLNNEIDENTYYQIIYRLGEPIEFNDPLSGAKSTLTLEKARELSKASRSGTLDLTTLKQELRNSLIEKLSTLLESI